MTAEGEGAGTSLVVGIGASAGGLEALQRFFDRMPQDSGMTFVVVQHLPPDLKSATVELLARHTRMPVEPISDGTRVARNRVYAIPPGCTLTIDGGALRLQPRERAPHTPIDLFFRSLAADQGEHAVAIVLSGSGSDGALGAREVKAQGGLTIAQDPSSAQFDSMPRHAIGTGVVDHVLPVDEMPARLLAYARVLGELRDKDPEQALGLTAAHLDRILTVLQRGKGRDFRPFKKSTLLRRIQRRLQVHHQSSGAAYVELLRDDPREVEALFQDLLIGVTSFFRDPEAYAALEGKVIPKLFEQARAEVGIRAWAAGCASGEEAYTLAILLYEQMLRGGLSMDLAIFATDIDERGLESARAGLYPEGIAEQVSPQRLERFFERENHEYRVVKRIRELCIFAPHDLLTDPPFSRLDLISCRNLLIYLESEPQERLMPILHYALRPGGYLFLGAPEAVPGERTLFRTVDKKHRIFQRREVTVRPPYDFPLGVPALFSTKPRESGRAGRDAGRRELSARIEGILARTFAPPCVVIDRAREVVYIHGRTGRYLEPPAGQPIGNILEMAREGLRVELRTAIHRAFQSGKPVVRRGVTVRTNGGTQQIELEVRPLAEGGEDGEVWLVAFREVAPGQEGEELVPAAAGATPSPGAGAAAADDRIVRDLEAELTDLQDRLQAVVEELESSNEELTSSNEELLSMNEELQSANEELQTSKEEAHSVNEELETVNAELNAKIQELDAAHSDLRNLFHSTRIATLFLDEELHIRRFTPAATELFRMKDNDVGRPITDLAARFDSRDLPGEIRQVLRTLTPLEREVRIADRDLWFTLRISPYRSVENAIGGIVLTFTDCTRLKNAEEQTARLAAVVESSGDAIVGFDLGGAILSWNEGAARLYGYEARETVGRSMAMLIPEADRAGFAAQLVLIRGGERIQLREAVRLRKGGERIIVSESLSPVQAPEGAVHASSIARDITELKQAEERREAFLAMVGHELRNPIAVLHNCLGIFRSSGRSVAEGKAALAMMDRQSRHLGRLVDDLLELSRYTRGKLALRLAPVDVARQIRDVIAERADMLEEAQLALGTDLPRDPVWIMGDETRIAQAIGNLLENAVGFSRRGSRIAVWLRADPEGAVARLVIADEGAGMSGDELAHAFEAFWQGSPPDRIRQGGAGLGLGLAVVRLVAEAHGGQVWAESPGPGGGTSVTLELPLARRRRAAPETEAPTAPAPRRILIVEDDADAAESFRLMLELRGHEVHVARDGGSALEAARELRPEIVLSDIALPGSMDGRGLARALRGEPGLERVLLVAVSGFGRPQDVERSVAAGFDAHLSKPIDFGALQRLLSRSG